MTAAKAAAAIGAQPPVLVAQGVSPCVLAQHTPRERRGD